MLNKKQSIFILLFLSAIKLNAQVTFVIESLPKATPKGDAIYITGSFNDWRVNDPAFALHKQLDGRLAITLPIDAGSFEYKFTRGSWMMVETDAQNTYTSNRYYESPGEKVIYVKIENWLDLGGAEVLHFTTFFFFAVAFQGLILLFIGHRIEKRSTRKFRAFVGINILLIMLFTGAVAYNVADHMVQSYLIFFLQIFFFAWGPCLYAFIAGFTYGKLPNRFLLHLIPLWLVALFTIARIMNVETFAFLLENFHGTFTYENLLIPGSGVLFNLGYFIKSAIAVKTFEYTKVKADPQQAFLHLMWGLNVVALLCVVVNLLLLLVGISSKFVIDYELVFIALSLIIFSEIYFVWKYPELLKDKANHTPIENEKILKEKIHRLMIGEKPYKNSALNVELLARMLDMKPYTLSRILNEYFHQNFRDFVNGFRIEEFIHLAENGILENYTFLALAHEVGFNSKSTFNLAFKKYTGQNPRDYFKTRNQTAVPNLPPGKL